MEFQVPGPSINFFDKEFPKHRREILNELRETHPVMWHEQHQFWTLARYRDVERTALDTDVFSSIGSVSMFDEPGTPDYEVQVRRLSGRDDPGHAVLRRMASQAFAPRAIKSLEERLTQASDRLVDTLESKLSKGEEVDFITEFAYPFPVMAVNAVLGISDDILDFLKEYEIGNSGLLLEHFDLLVKDRRRHLGDDLMSELIRATDADQRYLSPADLHYFIAGFWSAGNLTTTSLFAQCLVMLQRQPEAAAAIRDDPNLLPPFVEEVLRYEAPVTASFKIATRDVEIDGKKILAGQRVWLLWAAANHDPAVFARPEEFDLTRKPNRHLSFAYAAHFCLGAPLARLEARIGLRCLMDRNLSIRVDEEAAERTWGRNLYGYSSLPIVAS
jgi:cytochrome P450